MVTNNELQKAKNNKKDEFYTQLSDIEKEMEYYKESFKDKIILCNCDHPLQSSFWKYFHQHFKELGLKKLISIHYDSEKPSYKLEYSGGNDIYYRSGELYSLKGNGDFRSEESIEALKEADIVVTNPPFSLFREYISQLVKYDKKFLIIGNMNAVTCKEVFPLIRDNKLWYGASIHSGDRKFYVPDDYPLMASTCGVDEEGKRFVRVKGVRWFTNLDYSSRHTPIKLINKYNSEEYPAYENYDAINVNKYSQIPNDYEGIMGAPITLLDYYCPEQFEILGISASWDETDVMKKIKTSNKHRHVPILNGKEIYRRIFIKKVI